MIREEVLKQGAEWVSDGKSVVVATIVRIRGSSSQPLAARMVATSHDFVGAVSGGCVETDVREAARSVIADGRSRMLHYDQVENEDIDIGLNCEGAIDVLLEPLTPTLADFLQPHERDLSRGRRLNWALCSPDEPEAPRVRHGWIRNDRIYTLAAADEPSQAAGPVERADSEITALRGHPEVEKLLNVEMPHAGAEDGSPDGGLSGSQQGAVSPPEAGPSTLDLRDGRCALVEPVLPPPRLMVFGAVDVAAPLSRLARIMGYETVISDARGDYARSARFPDADEVLAGWPHEILETHPPDVRTAVVSLNHEPRFEDDLFHTLVRHAPVAYVGAIGKPLRHEERLVRAQRVGVDLSCLGTIHTPIGLELGGKEPEHIALSIISEILAVAHRRGGGPMMYRTGHGDSRALPGGISRLFSG